MDTLDRPLSILLSLAILGLAVLLRKLTRSWATPACLFTMFWFLFTMLPLAALYFVPVSPFAVGYIFLACLAFSLPALTSNWQQLLLRNAQWAPQREAYLDSPFIRTVFALCCLTSVAFILVDLLVQGITLPEMIFNFFESSNTYLELRYEGDIKVNLFGQWGLILAYLCVIFGSLVHAGSRSPRLRALVLLMLMLPPILVMLMQAAKGLFFVAIAILLGGHLIHRLAHDQRPHVDVRGLAAYAKYIVVAAPLVLLSFLARGLYALDDSDAVIERLLAYLGSYAFLHLYAFSDWLMFATGQPASMAYDAEPSATLGYFTFIALFKLLGSTKIVPPGTYDEYFAFASLSPGNIYTIFRGLITDFGLPGSLLALTAMGAIFNAAYKRMLGAALPAVSVAAMFLFVQVLYSSYLISALIYNTAYLVFALSAVILIANRWLHARRADERSHSRTHTDAPLSASAAPR